jgi:spermidine/putrescine transport system substrate-binding protein
MTDVISRRQLLERAAKGGAILTVPGLLAACGGGGEESASGDGEQDKTLAKTLHMSNWTFYIDIDEKTKKHPSLDGFKKKTGTTVAYTEDVNDNASFFNSKLQGPLSRGQSTGRDIVVMTDNSRYPGLLIRKGWAEKLDKSAIPNIKNLEGALAHPGFDPDREYSLPWQSGMTGIAYNDKLTDPVTSVKQLLEDPKLKGKVTLLTEMGDTMALVIADNGDDPTKVTDATFDKAIKRIQKAVDGGQIRRFTGNDYTGPLARGDYSASMSWSGDIVQLANPRIHWNLPDAGGDIWTDNMLIPKGGDVYTASVFMNYVYDPKVAAVIEAYINYICPVKGAKEEMLKLDKSLANNKLIFPTQEMLDNVYIFDSAALDNQKYLEAWQNLITA